VIGPHDNVFPGPAVALDGSAYTFSGVFKNLKGGGDWGTLQVCIFKSVQNLAYFSTIFSTI